MCDVCKLNGEDYKFKTNSTTLFPVTLYKVFAKKAVTIKLCRIHDIELWRKGEIWFLSSNLKLAYKLANGFIIVWTYGSAAVAKGGTPVVHNGVKIVGANDVRRVGRRIKLIFLAALNVFSNNGYILISVGPLHLV